MNQDKSTVQIVLVFVGLIALTLAAGMLYLNANGMRIDPVLSTVGAGALGALTAMLVSTRTQGAETVVPDQSVDTAQPVSSEIVGADLPVTDLSGTA